MIVSVVGDLHLFAGRSKGDEIFEELQHTAADTLIICGDLFDFRWSSYSSLHEAFRAASHYLSALLEKTALPVVYILGNHDGIQGFQPWLDELSDRFSHFEWHEDLFQLGGTLFIHGDIPLRNEGRSVRGRKFKENEKIYSPFISWGYTLFTRLKLIALYRKLFRKSSPLPLIESALESDGFEGHRVIFGHTHFAMKSVMFGDREYHNCGAPMKGFQFHTLTLEIN